MNGRFELTQRSPCSKTGRRWRNRLWPGSKLGGPVWPTTTVGKCHVWENRSCCEIRKHRILQVLLVTHPFFVVSSHFSWDKFVISPPWVLPLLTRSPLPESHRESHELDQIHWLVVWNMNFMTFQYIDWEFHHPKWRSHIFLRGRIPTDELHHF